MNDPSESEPARGGGRLLLRVGLVGLVAYLVMIAMLAVLQRSLTYFPVRASAIDPADSGLPPGQVHAIQMAAADGLQLHGWHVLPLGESADTAEQARRQLGDQRPVVLYFSGNGGNRAYRGEEFQLLAAAGCHVLVFDYRGYAENPGRPSEVHLVADALAAWRYATETLHIDPSRIVLYGESLGGGVAVQLAADRCRAGQTPGGLILRSTFSSLIDVAAHHYPWLPVRLLMIDRYESAGHIHKVACPILQLHGTADTIVPLAFGRRLFAAAPQHSTGGIPKQFVELAADHNDVVQVAHAACEAAIRKFLAAVE